ncbi:hypothetical protein VTL71DRAFT_5877 [Oculimacula yallundae]|uniref:Uncharacterized protein n=1 Tax=Oculimacula yallundae TaxID=86028 RepID=A0ABR4BYQ6_9HELO
MDHGNLAIRSPPPQSTTPPPEQTASNSSSETPPPPPPQEKPPTPPPAETNDRVKTINASLGITELGCGLTKPSIPAPPDRSPSPTTTDEIYAARKTSLEKKPKLPEQQVTWANRNYVHWKHWFCCLVDKETGEKCKNQNPKVNWLCQKVGCDHVMCPECYRPLDMVKI